MKAGKSAVREHAGSGGVIAAAALKSQVIVQPALGLSSSSSAGTSSGKIDLLQHPQKYWKKLLAAELPHFYHKLAVLHQVH